MEETPCPDDVVYVASVKELEDLKIAEELADGVYGQMRSRSVTATDTTVN